MRIITRSACFLILCNLLWFTATVSQAKGGEKAGGGAHGVQIEASCAQELSGNGGHGKKI